MNVSRIASLGRRHGLDLLIVVGALASALEIALGQDAARTRAWWAAPAAALLVLLLLGRHRWRFAAPASLWLLAAALSFADGGLVTSTTGVFVAGMAAAFLLGNVPDPLQRRVGLAIVLGAAAIVVANKPDRTRASSSPSRSSSRSPGWPASRSGSATPRPKRRRSGRRSPSGSATRRPASPWPRSGRGSPASCTTSSPTR